MDETTDKSVSPEETTESEEALTDKDLGQETSDTGESQDGSNPSPKAPDDGSDDAEDTTEDDQTTSEDEGSDSEEGSLLTPEEVAKLPRELKATYVSMNKAFQAKMGLLNQAIATARQAPPPADKPAETAETERPQFIDRTKLAAAKTQEDVLAIMEDGFQKLADYVADQKLGKALEPIHQKEAAAEVNAYFKQFPDRAKFKVAMGKLDQKTKGSMTLDELYYAVSGSDRERADNDRKQRKLRNLSKGNADTASGQSGKPSGDGDIFDEIAKAGGHGNSVLR